LFEAADITILDQKMETRKKSQKGNGCGKIIKVPAGHLFIAVQVIHFGEKYRGCCAHPPAVILLVGCLK